VRLAASLRADAVEVHVAAAPSELAAELVATADALFIAQTPNREALCDLLARGPGLRWVASKWAGADKLLCAALVEHACVLTNGSGVWSRSLGEFALCGILHFAKDVPRLLSSKAAGKWDVFNMQTISAQTVGIVGHGDIGRHVARRCKAMDMRVLALRRDTLPRDGDEDVDTLFSSAELHALLPLCDYVVVSTPLTAATRGMIGAEQLALMKRSAVLINIGRGPVLEEAALVAALEARALRGAVLDVFEVEPLPPASPLWRLDNVLLSAHTADRTATSGEESVDLFLEQWRRWRSGVPLQNVVNKLEGY
jgi:phosphoglycerate dehydrogenase-like enzyme